MTEAARREGEPWEDRPRAEGGMLSLTVSPLEARNIHKSYPYADGKQLQVLQGVNLRVEPREVVAVIGASGAGKSTLLHILGALDRPTTGEVLLGGRSLAGVDDREIATVRNRHLGFVFQFHHLLREFTALENAMMPCMIGGVSRDEARSRAKDLLEAVGLGRRMDHKPWQLSGGEQQRVAVARALANQPLVLLADEPSGNLDHHTSEQLHDTLFQLREARGLSMILVTHNLELAERAERILRLEDGVLTDTGGVARR
jgi:lipoprotein-releasing system ATP-binding protein